MNEYLARLSTLVEQRRNEIIDQWGAAARKLPRAQHLDEPLVLDHMPQLLRELSAALTEAQSLSIVEMNAHDSARAHGVVRFELGFDIEEVIAEFGLLRDVIQQSAEASGVNISGEVNRTVNRVIDKAIAVSLETYLRQQAEEAERKRREYLSFIVHDLKTPISAMVTATYVIDHNLGAERSGIPPDVGKMIDLLRRNASRLNARVMEIINEESRLRSLSTGGPELPLERREVDLWPVVERLKDDCQSIADLQRNKIRNDVPHNLRLSVDPELLLQVFQNLLSNALKYTTDGEIVIGGEEDSNSVVCWVNDTGIGIAPERLKEILQKGSADPNVPGSSGLGLVLVQKVMQLHGGKVAVQSAQGLGSNVRLEFPKPNTKAA